MFLPQRRTQLLQRYSVPVVRDLHPRILSYPYNIYTGRIECFPHTGSLFDGPSILHIIFTWEHKPQPVKRTMFWLLFAKTLACVRTHPYEPVYFAAAFVLSFSISAHQPVFSCHIHYTTIMCLRRQRAKI